MAHIEQFTVHGLAGRTDTVHRKLDRNLNVFWGLNGCGKTSLLKILHSSLMCDSAALERIPFERAEVIFWSRQHKARILRTFSRDETAKEDDPESMELFDLEPAGDGFWREVRKSGGNTKGWSSTVLEGKVVGDVNTKFMHSYLPISRLSQINRRYAGNSRSSLDLSRGGRPLLIGEVMIIFGFLH